MSKRQWLCLFGVWMMLFLFLGIPFFWQRIIAIISGLIIVAIAYNLPHERKAEDTSASSVFTENNNQSPHTS